MREFMAGAVAGLFAYGAAWWSAGSEPSEAGGQATRAPAAVLAQPSPPPPASGQRSLPSTRAAQAQALRVGPAGVVAGAAALAERRPQPLPAHGAVGGVPASDARAVLQAARAPSDVELDALSAALPAPLRRLAEFRRAAETPDELVKRVEGFELSPAELAQFRQIASQLFEGTANGTEAQPSPWGPRARRNGELPPAP